jgi:hypothetical protein
MFAFITFDLRHDTSNFGGIISPIFIVKQIGFEKREFIGF